jgi:hypothetical protein
MEAIWRTDLSLLISDTPLPPQLAPNEVTAAAAG